jgi:hypothetical protein
VQGLDPSPSNSPGNCSHRAHSRGNSRFCHPVNDRYPGTDTVGFERRQKKGISGTVMFKILPGTYDTLTCSPDRWFLISNDGCNCFPEVKPVPDHYLYYLQFPGKYPMQGYCMETPYRRYL